jgi:hypothetical protein
VGVLFIETLVEGESPVVFFGSLIFLAGWMEEYPGRKLFLSSSLADSVLSTFFLPVGLGVWWFLERDLMEGDLFGVDFLLLIELSWLYCERKSFRGWLDLLSFFYPCLLAFFLFFIAVRGMLDFGTLIDY